MKQLSHRQVILAGVAIITCLLVYYSFSSTYALNDTTYTWTFSSSTAADYTYDTSLISIDNSGARPSGGQVGANHFANASFESGNTSWITEADAPVGWAVASGNPDYGTEDFLVMQYEAKYDCTGDGIGDTAADCSAPADSGLGLDRRDIGSFSPNNVVSTPEGAPIVHITQTQALSSCPVGFHLITNDEWMTLARDIEAQSGNWANNTIGSTVAGGGGLKRGNVGINDSASYNSATDPDYYTGTSRDPKAMHVLSNGRAIWDLSGNVWEWTSDTIQRQHQPVAWNGETDASAFNWSGFSDDGLGRWIKEYKVSSPLQVDDVQPSNYTWNAAHGVGRIYHYSDMADSNTTVYAFLRGGNWNDEANAGAFAL